MAVDNAEKGMWKTQKEKTMLPKKGIYRHYKGNLYELVDVANHSETLEKMVVYRALYGERELWVRPLQMWNEEVVVDEKKVKRFALEKEI